MDATMRVAVIWIVWLALVLWWLSPNIENVKNKVADHNAQIERALNE